MSLKRLAVGREFEAVPGHDRAHYLSRAPADGLPEGNPPEEFYAGALDQGLRSTELDRSLCDVLAAKRVDDLVGCGLNGRGAIVHHCIKDAQRFDLNHFDLGGKLSQASAYDRI